MRWYWWLAIGLVVGIFGFLFIPKLLKQGGNPDSLEAARKAKEEKRLKAENEKPEPGGNVQGDII